MRNALRLGRLFGIEIRVDSSWLFIFFLVTWSLTSVFTQWHPDWRFTTSLLVAVVAALLFFASVLFHEMAHSLVARRYGIPVRDITLHLFGGVSNIEREPPTPGAEFLIAVVGPLASVGLGVAMMAIGAGMTNMLAPDAETAAEAVRHLGPATTALMWLGPVNVMVGLFNMIPGFPLDGGRILRSILWRITGDLRRATQLATGAGQLVGWGFIAMGVFMALGQRVPFFGTGLVSGIWLALIGLFLRNAARQQDRGAALADALEGRRVRDLMRTEGTTVWSSLPIRSLVESYFMRHDDRALPVFEETDRGPALVGLICVDDVRRVRPEEWDVRTVRDAMTPRSELVVTEPDAELGSALQALGARGVRQLPVLRDGQLVGMLVEQDVARWLSLQASTARPTGFPPPRHA